MKNITKIFAIALVALGFSTSALAQATATAASQATIITPISIVKDVDMNFGTIAVSAITGGTVILSTANTRSTGGAGGVTLPNVTGTVTSAKFTVSGLGGSTYAITLPSSATLTIEGGGSQEMTVSSFTSNPNTTGTIESGGSQEISVGATLTVVAGQAAGVYKNLAGVPVTVNYN